MKKAVNIIVVTNDTSIASFVPASAIQDGTAYAKYLRFSILLPFQVNVIRLFQHRKRHIQQYRPTNLHASDFL